MENAYALWKKGTSGSHHVWGKVELDQKGEIEMILFRHEKYKFLNRIGKFFKIKHLDQQIRLLGNLNKFDVLYAPYSFANTRLLVFLKWIGLFKKPIVVTIHQPAFSSIKQSKFMRWLTKKLLLQYDASIFLSEQLMKDTVNLLQIPEETVKEKFSTAQWGPDIDFYHHDKEDTPLENCNYFISAGHTDRDYDTLIEAFRGIDYPLRIFCAPKNLPKTKDIPEHITIVSTGTPYIELLDQYRGARAIMVPLKYPSQKEGCQGMTSIQDVIALGKPTIMTKNRSLNLDVEKEGFGITVGMGDVEGWRKAVHQLIHDEETLNRMGANAKRTFLEKCNSRVFGEKLEEALKKVHNKNGIKVE
jgi:glycosyltransferase involved in cell wall biosynthesis